MLQPDISVLMAVFNDREFISDSIRSILEQSFHDFEFIIIDDGSTDGSTDELISWAKKDSRIKLFHQKNRGLPHSLNRALSEAKGRLVARMDADDISLPGRFAAQREVMNAEREIGVLGTNVTKIDISGLKTKESWLLPSTPGLTLWRTLFDCSLVHPTVMIRRELLQQVGGYDESCYRAQDYELWIRLALRTRMQSLPEVFLHRRVNKTERKPDPYINQIIVKRLSTLHAAILQKPPNIGCAAFCNSLYGPLPQNMTSAQLINNISYIKRLFKKIVQNNVDACVDLTLIKKDLDNKILKIAYNVQEKNYLLGQSLKALTANPARVFFKKFSL